MNFTPLHLALRETQALARRPQAWIVLGAVGLLMGMVGPFGTFEMPVVPRLAYWIAVVVGTTALCLVVERSVVHWLDGRLPALLAAALGGALGGIPIALCVRAFNFLVFGNEGDPMSVWALLAYSIPIAALVTTSAQVLLRDEKPGGEAGESREPALLDRLPRPQRGRLLHIAVSDHYVDVTTDRGTTLVLMRLSDAIREATPVVGLQVHRSHWVALDAVRRSLRQGSKPMLELENGTLVPVSRSYAEAVKAAGLL
ncbi:LytTR family DNA-binding domain-containing protein [Devosia rhizoryzae]|uniref:LytTR family transcriptional regulator n=1 Tax=Devosia rhizoryzae TaxID=2774137 RepID=A0ABX7C4Y8_9HYPH|nr:LytTR family DNA-binding domain-containing protein [Devosia rhizoryzae]QQR38807.1 LytTR family transcriptional regulator [Devosia rhizoryzae]